MSNDQTPIAGKNFPWHYLDGAFLRIESFLPFDKGSGGAKRIMGAYALVTAELPNPDVEAEQRLITLPVENMSDYKALSSAHQDIGVKTKTSELILLYQHRRGFFGGSKPRFHLAGYPAGTWLQFFDAVSKYAAKEFRWPAALFSFRPTSLTVFPSANCITSDSLSHGNAVHSVVRTSSTAKWIFAYIVGAGGVSVVAAILRSSGCASPLSYLLAVLIVVFLISCGLDPSAAEADHNGNEANRSPPNTPQASTLLIPRPVVHKSRSADVIAAIGLIVLVASFTYICVHNSVAPQRSRIDYEHTSTSGGAPAINETNPNSNSMAHAAYDFLDAVLKGDTQRASSRLTPQAMQRIIASGKQFSSPGLESVTFKIGEVRASSDERAIVQCVLTDNSNGTPHSEEICCLLRKVDRDWYVSGIAYGTSPDKPWIITDFESGQNMAVPRQIAGGTARSQRSIVQSANLNYQTSANTQTTTLPPLAPEITPVDRSNVNWSDQDHNRPSTSWPAPTNIIHLPDSPNQEQDLSFTRERATGNDSQAYRSDSTEHPAVTLKDSFSIGSHKDEVLRIQGIATNVTRNPAVGYEVWKYGPRSSVTISLKTGRVIQWRNFGDLQVSLKTEEGSRNR